MYYSCYAQAFYMISIKIFINKVLNFFGYSIKKNKNLSVLERLLLVQNQYIWEKVNLKKNNEFMNFIIKNFEKSNSSLFQDLFCLWVNKQNDEPYFVEFGAGNGLDFSNTLLLEKIGWKGLLIEPSSNFEECKKNRSAHTINYAVTSKSNLEIKFYESIDKNFSSTNPIPESKIKKITSITLTDALKLVNAPKFINFLSIDIEGGELDALYGMDFKIYYVKCIVIEHNNIQSNQEKIYQLLSDNNFKRVFENQTLYEDWYINEG